MNVSNNQIFWRLMWKEYRSQRGLWLGIAGMALFLQVVTLLIWREQQGQFGIVNVLYGISLLLSSLYALTSCAVLFAAEKEDGTYDLLRSLPITPMRLFVGKMTFCLVTSIGMAYLLSGLVWLAARSLNLRDGGTERLFEQHVVFFGLIIAVGLFFSLKFNRVISVIIATVVTALALNLNDLLWLKFAGMAAFLLADGWLVRRWFLDDASMSDLIVRQLPFVMTWRQRARSLSWAGTETAAPWWRAWKRTLWLEWRQVKPVLCLWFPAALVLVAISPWLFEISTFDFSTVIMPLAPLFLGLAVFRGHQREHRIRFLTENGIPPQLVWVSSQLMWFAATVFVVVGLAATHIGSMMVKHVPHLIYFDMATYLDREPYVFYVGGQTTQWWGAAGFYIWFALLSYTAGQVCSLKFPKTAIATFMGLVVTGLAYLWLSVMVRLPVPYWLCAAPILLIWLGVSFRGLRRWSLGTSTWWTKTRTMILLVLLHALQFGAIGYYRTVDLRVRPEVTAWLNDTVSPYGGITGLAVDNGPVGTSDPYAKAASLITELPGRVEGAREKFKDNPQALQAANDEWVDDNRVPRELLISAIQSRARPDPQYFSSEDVWHCGELLTFAAKKQSRSGELDQALQSFQTFFEFNELTELSFKFDARTGSEFAFHRTLHIVLHSTLPYSYLMEWAAHEQQTPARLRQAIQIVKRHRLSPALVQQGWDADWAQNRWLMEQDMVSSDFYTSILTLLPWEKPRCQRLLDYEAWNIRNGFRSDEDNDTNYGTHNFWRWRANSYRISYGDDTGIADSYNFYMIHDDRATHPQIKEMYQHGAVMLRMMIEAESSYRACLLRLELMAQRLETGSLPRQLADTLKTLDTNNLIDPWSDRQYEYYPEGLPNDLNDFRFRGESRAVVKAGVPFIKGETDSGKIIIPTKRNDEIYYVLDSRVRDKNHKFIIIDGIFRIPSQQ
ncbi:MAG: ABC transporter permease [Planctomycetaceae bacterium]